MLPDPFEKVVRRQRKVKMLLLGPPGSGKTWTALQVASKLAELEDAELAVIDSEYGRARAYAETFHFKHMELCDDHRPDRYAELILAAESHGYGAVVIDTITQTRNGVGGILDILHGPPAARQPQGKVLQATAQHNGQWKARIAERALIKAINDAHIHVVATARAGTPIFLFGGNGEKEAHPAIGALSAWSGLEYEFDIAARLDIAHTLAITKSICPEVNVNAVISDAVEMVHSLYRWAEAGEAPHYLETPGGRERLRCVLDEIGFDTALIQEFLKRLEPERVLARFRDSILKEAALHERLRQIATELREPARARASWPTVAEVDALIEEFKEKHQLQTREVLEIGGVPHRYDMSPGGWGRYASHEEARDHLEAAFARLLDQQSKNSKPERSKAVEEEKALQATALQATVGEAERAVIARDLRAHAFDAYRLDEAVALEIMEVEDWAAFDSQEEARAALKEAVLKRGMLMVATTGTLKGPYFALNTAEAVRVTPRLLDTIDDETWREAVAGWTKVRQTYELPNPLLVKWKRGRGGKYLEALEVTPDVPF